MQEGQELSPCGSGATQPKTRGWVRRGKYFFVHDRLGQGCPGPSPHVRAWTNSIICCSFDIEVHHALVCTNLDRSTAVSIGSLAASACATPSHEGPRIDITIDVTKPQENRLSSLMWLQAPQNLRSYPVREAPKMMLHYCMTYGVLHRILYHTCPASRVQKFSSTQISSKVSQ